MENRLGNYLCKTNFKYNAKEMRGKNLEFIMARFNEQSKLYLQCCEREVLEVTEKTWNDAFIKTRERVLKLIPKKLYVKMIRSCTSDQRGKQKFFERFRSNLAAKISGTDLGAVTIIGPASIVREMKRDPKKIELILGK